MKRQAHEHTSFEWKLHVRMAVVAGSMQHPHVPSKIDCVYEGVVDREAHPRNLNQALLLTRLLTLVESMLASL